MGEMQQGVQFRFAGPADTALILRFIRALARYEGMEAQVVADEAMLEEWLFQRKKAEVLFALSDGTEVGFALFFHNFSTFLGRAGLYLEDLDWNRPSIDFYKALGAKPMEEWTVYRIDGETLQALGQAGAKDADRGQGVELD